MIYPLSVVLYHTTLDTIPDQIQTAFIFTSNETNPLSYDYCKGLKHNESKALAKKSHSHKKGKHQITERILSNELPLEGLSSVSIFYAVYLSSILSYGVVIQVHFPMRSVCILPPSLLISIPNPFQS
jgi:hypothetical protein